MRLFKRIKLLTPESVELEFTLAGIGSRALAILVDLHVLTLALVLFWVLWGIFSAQLLNYLERLGMNYRALPIWLLAIALLGSFIVSTGYFAVFELMWQGQTPGKRFAKIRVIRDDGRPIGMGQAALRALLQPFDYFLFIGFFLILFGKREKRLGDWVAGTIVIQEERPEVKTRLTLSEAAKQLAVELPNLARLSALQPDEFAVVSDYLHRRDWMSRNGRSEVSLKLARRVREIVQFQSIPEGLTSDQFLEAVYVAYQNQLAA